MAPIPDKSNQSNPSNESVSVDEMMARLKRGNRKKRHSESKEKRKSEGELVTREDGTQAIKVRRRKRRSKQPKKQSQTDPRLKWILLGCFGIGFVLLIVASIFIIVKYNGRTFKADTESMICSLSGSQSAELTQLRVTPVSAKANKVDIHWDKHSFIQNASFNNLRADIKATSFFSKNWIGEEIVASTGTLHLQVPQPSSEPNEATASPPYEFEAYRCNQLSLSFGDQRKAPQIADIEVSLRELANEQKQIVFSNGTLKIPDWPQMQLASGVLTLKSKSADIEARLVSESSNQGEITLKGSLPNNTRTAASLDVSAKNFPMEELLGKEMGRLIQGNIQSRSGSFSYDYNKAPEEALSFNLPFNATELFMSGLPMFKDLKKLTGETAYARVNFFNSTGVLMRTAQGLTLSEIDFANSSLLTMEGSIRVNHDGALSGTLKLGVPESYFEEEVPAPFTGPNSGFYHIDVKLAGNIRTPSDNLHSQLKPYLGASSRSETKALLEALVPEQQKKKPENGEKQPAPEGEPSEKDFDKLYPR
ncbi:hypothetical protein HW115_16405 [Verrucomicrobiaceae bacterium N1E253]|uniref:AsmA-like C-terminal domain-containing protein n=1 Tax=Oceaniferula marina TaxID=2748318 RepID=A0A851GIN0_9BACT|nr:hypothetical protein [Oceaniferula marina]NWK57206.1 hypothetical protein [Oceaniferula marina]